METTNYAATEPSQATTNNPDSGWTTVHRRRTPHKQHQAASEHSSNQVFRLGLYQRPRIRPQVPMNPHPQNRYLQYLPRRLPPEYLPRRFPQPRHHNQYYNRPFNQYNSTPIYHQYNQSRLPPLMSLNLPENVYPDQ